MPDFFSLLMKWWKQLLVFVICGALVATIIVILQPKKYLATVTALAASPFGNDKSRIFNENIQALYPSIGTSDELDVVLSTSQLDTLYTSVARELQLHVHYKVKEKAEAAIEKAASLLRSDTKIRKGDYGELKIRVWHREKELAPEIANALANKLQQIHQHIQNLSNIASANALKEAALKIKKDLSEYSNNPTRDADQSMRIAVLTGQLQQYEMLANEFQIVIDSKPQALIIVETAKKSEWPDKPKKAVSILTAIALSFFFGLLIILILERRKVHGTIPR